MQAFLMVSSGTFKHGFSQKNVQGFKLGNWSVLVEKMWRDENGIKSVK